MELFGLLSQLVPLFHKMPGAFLGTASFLFVTYSIGTYIKRKLDRTDKLQDDATIFLKDHVIERLKKIDDSTIYIKDIKSDVEKISDKILSAKCLKK